MAAGARNRTRYHVRTLMVLVMVAALVLTGALALYRIGRSNAGYGPYASEADWPRALKSFVAQNPNFNKGVEPYGLGDFIDHRSIWRIESESPLLVHLLSNMGLESVGYGHPKSGELIGNVPYGWTSFDWAKCDWYATPGYGSQRIEGVDLYLIAVDADSGSAFVMHESLF